MNFFKNMLANINAGVNSNIVGKGSSKPSFSITQGDVIKKVFEEHGDYLWLMFILGIITGIIIHWLYSIVKNFFFSEEDSSESNQEVSNEDTDPQKENQQDRPNTDKRE